MAFSFNQVGKDNVHLALSLIGYDDEIRAAMAYVFGTTFVCDDMDNAKKVHQNNYLSFFQSYSL